MDQSCFLENSLKEIACISEALAALANKIKKAVLKVSKSNGMEIIGSNGALERALKTRARSQEGVLNLSTGQVVLKF